MTTTYYFYSAGSIPGIPGIFAGVAVEVDEAGREILNVSPLGQAIIVEAAPAPSQSSQSPEIIESKES
jgi:hypothetical protein